MHGQKLIALGPLWEVIRAPKKIIILLELVLNLVVPLPICVRTMEAIVVLHIIKLF